MSDPVGSGLPCHDTALASAKHCLLPKGTDDSAIIADDYDTNNLESPSAVFDQAATDSPRHFIQDPHRRYSSPVSYVLDEHMHIVVAPKQPTFHGREFLGHTRSFTDRNGLQTSSPPLSRKSSSARTAGPPGSHGRTADPRQVAKRPAHSDLHEESGTSPTKVIVQSQPWASRRRKQRSPPWQQQQRRRGSVPTPGLQPQPTTGLSQPYVTAAYDLDRPIGATKHGRVPQDSGYGSRSTTLQIAENDKNHGVVISNPLPPHKQVVTVRAEQMKPLIKGKPVLVSSSQPGGPPIQKKARYCGLILQPESSPISPNQLATEVKGIYAGLVMVETKCINIDAVQASDKDADLSPEQWQALVALHRTLLYEHHDFLMATQHPSANESLRGLATKYSMPARMWKHAIHAFLEVLRHRRPKSQEYMLAFIYLAYQMIALLYETVETFKDTWIECLGDLARYRMAIEDEKEAHALWGSVAAYWYSLASDRNPAIGRLNHHLGILERPSIRKLYSYAKALTCQIPFSNARDSLGTLCGPIVQEEHDQTLKSGGQATEIRLLVFHARTFMQASPEAIHQAQISAMHYLNQEPASWFQRVGPALAISNAAAILEYGLPTNALRGHFIEDAGRRMAAKVNPPSAPPPNAVTPTDQTLCSSLTAHFAVSCFRAALNHCEDKLAVCDTLPMVHVWMVFIRSICFLPTRFKDHHNTCGVVMDPSVQSAALCNFLNTVAVYFVITPDLEESAKLDSFPKPRQRNYKCLWEDFMILGLLWSSGSYFADDYFEGRMDQDGRYIEDEDTHKLRASRVLWLGLCLAKRSVLISFDHSTKRFVNISENKTMLEEGQMSPSSQSATMSAPSEVGGDSTDGKPSARLTYANMDSMRKGHRSTQIPHIAGQDIQMVGSNELPLRNISSDP